MNLLNKFFIFIGISGILMLAFLMSISLVSAGVANLSSDVGSSYIHWSWNYTNNTTSTGIYIDSNFTTNTSLVSYTLHNLEALEEHSISLINISNQSEIFATNKTKTAYPPFIFYILLVSGFLLFVFTVVLKNFIISTITGTLGFITSLGAFHLSFPLHLSFLSYLCLMTGVLCVLWTFGKMFIILKQEADILEW